MTIKNAEEEEYESNLIIVDSILRHHFNLPEVDMREERLMMLAQEFGYEVTNNRIGDYILWKGHKKLKEFSRSKAEYQLIAAYIYMIKQIAVLKENPKLATKIKNLDHFLTNNQGYGDFETLVCQQSVAGIGTKKLILCNQITVAVVATYFKVVKNNILITQTQSYEEARDSYNRVK